MPNPKKGQTKEDFISEYMSDPQAIKDFPDKNQRAAVAYSEWKEHIKKKHEMPGIGEFPSGSSVYIPGFKKRNK